MERILRIQTDNAQDAAENMAHRAGAAAQRVGNAAKSRR